MIKRKTFTKVTASAKARSRSASLQLSRGSVLQHEGKKTRKGPGHAGLVHVEDLVFDLKATGCSDAVRTRWGEMIRED